MVLSSNESYISKRFENADKRQRSESFEHR